MLKGIGKDAAQEAVRGADAIADEFRDRTIPVAEAAAQAIVNNFAGQILTAVGSLEIALGSLPEQIVAALDGLQITITVTRRQSPKETN